MIVILCIFYVIYVTVDAILMYNNEYIDDSYVMVIVIFFLPLYFALILIMALSFNDSKGRRMFAAYGILAIVIIIIIYVIWALVYFLKLYHEEEIY